MQINYMLQRRVSAGFEDFTLLRCDHCVAAKLRKQLYRAHIMAAGFLLHCMD
jgi:hypothetical protein